MVPALAGDAARLLNPWVVAVLFPAPGPHGHTPGNPINAVFKCNFTDSIVVVDADHWVCWCCCCLDWLACWVCGDGCGRQGGYGGIEVNGCWQRGARRLGTTGTWAVHVVVCRGVPAGFGRHKPERATFSRGVCAPLALVLKAIVVVDGRPRGVVRASLCRPVGSGIIGCQLLRDRQLGVRAHVRVGIRVAVDDHGVVLVVQVRFCVADDPHRGLVVGTRRFRVVGHSPFPAVLVGEGDVLVHVAFAHVTGAYLAGRVGVQAARSRHDHGAVADGAGGVDLACRQKRPFISYLIAPAARASFVWRSK